MKDQKGLVVSRLTITAFIVAFLFVVAQLNDANKQLAQNITTRGLHSLSAMRSDDMMALNSQFSGDPSLVLKEASLAPDLKTITESEYQDLLKNAVLVVTTNSPEILPNGATVTSGSFKAMGGGGMMGSTYSTSEGSVVSDVVPADAQGVVSSGSAVMVTAGSDGSITTSYNSMPPVGVPEGAVMVSTDGSTVQSGSIVAVSRDGSMSGMMPIDAKVISSSASLAKATSYVSYTNVHGETVVIGFDAHNLPLFKSVFKK